ncbi:hypothetical protein GDO81_022187 [Engystomops pustulosus]|uniref:UPAR/Ly6 domain-containing protein n=1 Tax=Engystomops pustulosus TaxID=76066 RepID=A0AAV6ZIS5_ENGPU|nr:hypothetical protein GDO81_022187 [Engystomops pustulosus]
MKPVIISIFLISFSLSIAAVLQCYSCRAKNNVTCEPEIVNCTEGDRCVTISEYWKYYKIYRSVSKGCAEGLPCGVIPHGGVNCNISLRYNIQCCDTDLCNAKSYEMPDLGEPRGRLCPSCHKDDTIDGCEAKKMVRCQEEGDKCLRFSGTVKHPDGYVTTYSVRGCVSPMECELNLKRLVGIEVIQQSKYECTDPKGSLTEEEKLLKTTK